MDTNLVTKMYPRFHLFPQGTELLYECDELGRFIYIYIYLVAKVVLCRYKGFMVTIAH